MPGCLGMDAMWQLTGFYLPWLGEPGRGRALGVGQVKFSGQVLPDAKVVSYEIDIRLVMRGKLALVIADGRTLVDGHEIYVDESLRVGTIDRKIVGEGMRVAVRVSLGGRRRIKNKNKTK